MKIKINNTEQNTKMTIRSLATLEKIEGKNLQLILNELENAREVGVPLNFIINLVYCGLLHVEGITITQVDEALEKLNLLEYSLEIIAEFRNRVMEALPNSASQTN